MRGLVVQLPQSVCSFILATVRWTLAKSSRLWSLASRTDKRRYVGKPRSQALESLFSRPGRTRDLGLIPARELGVSTRNPPGVTAVVRDAREKQRKRGVKGEILKPKRNHPSKRNPGYLFSKIKKSKRLPLYFRTHNSLLS